MTNREGTKNTKNTKDYSCEFFLIPLCLRASAPLRFVFIAFESLDTLEGMK